MLLPYFLRSNSGNHSSQFFYRKCYGFFYSVDIYGYNMRHMTKYCFWILPFSNIHDKIPLKCQQKAKKRKICSFKFIWINADDA